MGDIRRLFAATIVAVSGCIHVQAQPSLTNGLVAYFQFNGNANDSTANATTLAVVNLTFNTNRFGVATAAAQFSGNGYVSVGIPAISSIESNGEFSVSAWVLYNS